MLSKSITIGKSLGYSKRKEHNLKLFIYFVKNTIQLNEIHKNVKATNSKDKIIY